MIFGKLNDHEKNARNHPDATGLVWDATCTERVKRIEQALAATNANIERNATATHNSLEEIKLLIREESAKQETDRS